MILSAQQKFMLAAIQRLGCVRRDQLVASFRPAFCAKSPGVEERVADSALYRLRCCCQQVRVSNGVWHMSNAKENGQLLEAVDVMIELSGAKPLDYQKTQPPALLRFTVQEQKIRRFVVAACGEDLTDLRLGPYDRVILLFDGRRQAQPLAVSNKQFFAVRQKNGTHRYFAANGYEGGK